MKNTTPKVGNPNERCPQETVSPDVGMEQLSLYKAVNQLYWGREPLAAISYGEK